MQRDLTKHKKLTEGVNFREELPEGGVLYNETKDTVLILNPLGTRIWQLLDVIGCQPDLLAKALLNEYEDVDYKVIRDDIKEFILQLINYGFVVTFDIEMTD